MDAALVAVHPKARSRSPLNGPPHLPLDSTHMSLRRPLLLLMTLLLCASCTRRQDVPAEDPPIAWDDTLTLPEVVDTGAFATGRLTCAVLEGSDVRFLHAGSGKKEPAGTPAGLKAQL